MRDRRVEHGADELPREAADNPWARAEAIVRSLRPPRFSKRTFDIRAFGAVEGDSASNTEAIAASIGACAASGGGRVLVPPGRFLTGAVHLKSNVELHLCAGAELAFSTDPADYPMVHTRWEGVELWNYSPLIYAFRQRNIAITGPGLIDGQAREHHWWSWKGPWGGATPTGWRKGLPDQGEARAALFRMGEDGVPVERRRFGPGGYLRPCAVQTYGCSDVLIQDVRIRRSPFWNIHPVLCCNVTVRNVDVSGDGPNTDGCNPESVDTMLIEGCRFETGDDCIAINSGRNADGRRIATPSRNIVVRDCHMVSGHGGIVIGSQISGGAQSLFVSDCRMDGPELWHAIRIKSNSLRGGAIGDVHCRDIRVGAVAGAAVAIDFAYEDERGSFPPRLSHMTIERMQVGTAERALEVRGLADGEIASVLLRDCDFLSVRRAVAVEHFPGLKMEEVRIARTSDGRSG